jgi:hypothetical protein
MLDAREGTSLTRRVGLPHGVSLLLERAPSRGRRQAGHRDLTSEVPLTPEVDMLDVPVLPDSSAVQIDSK